MNNSSPTRRGWRGASERTKYLRSLAPGRRVWLMAAVFCTFASMGFVIDLIDLTVTRSHSMVLLLAALSGGVSATILLVVIAGMRWLPLAIGTMVLLILLPKGMPQTPGAETLASRAAFDGIGCLAAMAAGYSLFISFISREGVQRIRLDTEISLAREIHESLVPRIARRSGTLEIVGRSVPSSAVGGDLLDVIDHGGSLLAVVADVSGHGVPAGTLMAMVRATLRTRASGAYGLEDLCREVDRLLFDLERPEKFVTAAFLRVEGNAAIEALLAGHPSAMLVRSNGSVEAIEAQRPPLGVVAPRAVSACGVSRTVLAPGDLLAIVTDGLTEVVDRRKHPLDAEAIVAVLREHAMDPLDELADRVFERAARHGRAEDDQTLLLLRNGRRDGVIAPR